VKRSITLAAAALAALALAGCGTASDAPTSRVVPSVPGYNTPLDEARVGVRNALLPYPGEKGYAAGSAAPVEMRLFNDTGSPVQVEIKSEDASTVKTEGTITVPSLGLIHPKVQLTGLRSAVTSANHVTITVVFVGIKEFTVPLVIAPPEALR
jgi:hypothetical protein